MAVGVAPPTFMRGYMDYILDIRDSDINVYDAVKGACDAFEDGDYVTDADIYFITGTILMAMGKQNTHRIFNSVVSDIYGQLFKKDSNVLSMHDVMWIADEVLESSQFIEYQAYFNRTIYTVENPMPIISIRVDFVEWVSVVSVL